MADGRLILGLDASEFERGLAGARQSLGNFAKGAASFAAVAVAFKAVVTASIESERAIARLDQALNASGKNVGFTSAQLQEYAQTLQNTTSVGDEAILDLQSTLLSFQSVTGDTFKEATKLSLDLAQAMGMDLTSAAKTLGRALEDPAKAASTLRRANILLTDEQKNLIKAYAEGGDLASAQAVILQTLEDRVGGAAAAFRDTLPGALDALKESFGNLLESPSGSPKALKDALNELNNVLKDPKIIESAGILASGIVRAFSIAVQGIAKVTQAVQGLGEWMARKLYGPAVGDLEGINTELAKVDSQIAVLQQRISRGETLSFIDQKQLRDLQEQKKKYLELLRLSNEFGAPPAPTTSTDTGTVIEVTRGKPLPPPPPPKPKPVKAPVIDPSLRKEFLNLQEEYKKTFGQIPTYFTEATTGPGMRNAIKRGTGELEIYRDFLTEAFNAGQNFIDQQTPLGVRLGVLTKDYKNLTLEMGKISGLPAQGIEFKGPGTAEDMFKFLQEQRSGVKSELDALQQEFDSRKADFEQFYYSLFPEKDQAAVAFSTNINLINKALEDHIITADEAAEATRRLEKQFQETYGTGNYADDFGASWTKAFEDYKTQVEDTAGFAQRMFTTLTDGLTNAIVTFVETGKLSFKSLIKDIMHEIIKMLAQKIVMNFLGLFGGSSGGGNFFSSLFGGARAGGGPVMANKNYLVGERGPELFIPSGSGTIIPNDALGGRAQVTNVNYTIQAVDARSFKELVARDPEFIYSVSRAGARRLPA